MTSRSRAITLLLGALAVALFVFAVLGAFRSFDQTVELSPESSPVANKTITVNGLCDAAIGTAWNNDPKKQLKLWAVTVGTNMEGYTPAFGESSKTVLLNGGTQGKFPDPWCAPEARHRLIVSGWLLLGASAATVFAAVLVRRQRAERSPGATPAPA